VTVDRASGFVEGEKVRLLRLDDEFFVGIDPEDVSRLKRLVGLEWTVSGHSEHGFVEMNSCILPRLPRLWIGSAFLHRGSNG
jgi:hypothetical protein